MAEIAITEIIDRGMIDLKGDPAEPGFLAAAGSALGIDLPREPRRSTSRGSVTVLWLSIDQWLILVPRSELAAIMAKLDRALASFHCLAVDVSDARVIFRLEGEGSRETLMKGATVDLTTVRMTSGAVRRLNFAEIAAMVHVVSDVPETLDLYVFRSYATFTRNFLETAARPEARLTLFRSAVS